MGDGAGEWDGVLSRCMSAMGGHGGMGTGTWAWEVRGGMGRPRYMLTRGRGRVDACRSSVPGWVCMYAAQEGEKCLAADAGRLTHGQTHGTYCYNSRIECSRLRVCVFECWVCLSKRQGRDGEAEQRHRARWKMEICRKSPSPSSWTQLQDIGRISALPCGLRARLGLACRAGAVGLGLAARLTESVAYGLTRWKGNK